MLPMDSRRRNSVSEDTRFRLPAPDDSNYGQWYGNAEPGAEFEEQPSVGLFYGATQNMSTIACPTSSVALQDGEGGGGGICRRGQVIALLRPAELNTE